MVFRLRGKGFSDQPHNRAKGRASERDAERWLGARGYRVVDRNVHRKTGEIDLVAFEGDVLCFIEIKARANRSFGRAVESISLGKQKKLARTAAAYLAASPHDGPCRFDVLAMDLENEEWRFTLIRDAFQVPASSGRF